MNDNTVYVAVNRGGSVKFNAHNGWKGPRAYAYTTTGPARSAANKVEGRVLAVTVHADGETVSTEWLPAKGGPR